MTDPWHQTDAARVVVDHTTLRSEPQGADTRYTVGLKGPVNQRWVEAWSATQAESSGVRRFRLDGPTATVSFSCHTVDGAAVVFEMLEGLEALLAQVNLQTDIWGSFGETPPPAPARRRFAS